MILQTVNSLPISKKLKNVGTCTSKINQLLCNTLLGKNKLKKTKNKFNMGEKNDANIREIFVDYELGGYLQQKNIYILQSIEN